MKKYFISSDIHGFYQPWINSLNEAGFDINNKDHIIIVCGDLLDRGPDAIKCLKFFNSLLDQNRAIGIRGNHETMFHLAVNHGKLRSHDYHNGLGNTVMELAANSCGKKKAEELDPYELVEVAWENKHWQKYFNSLKWYYETDKYIFTHSWIPSTQIKRESNAFFKIEEKCYEYNPNWRNSSDEEFDASTWVNPFRQWNYGVVEPDKTIVSGHWHTASGHSCLHEKGIDNANDLIYYLSIEEIKDVYNGKRPDLLRKYFHTEPFKDKGIIGLDACTALSNEVNCITLSKGMKYIGDRKAITNIPKEEYM